MFSTIMWTVLLAYILYKTNNNQGKIKGKKNLIHIILLWLFLMTFSTSFKMLGWAVGHTSDIMKYFYISLDFIPAWINLTMWVLNLLFGILAIIIALQMAKRKKKYRDIFIKLLPIFYLLSTFEFIRGFWQAGSTENLSMIYVILSGLLLMSIFFGTLYYFYNRDDVKNNIFKS